MEQVIEFILARYSYWIVISLMLTGLYIVMSRGNLIKILVGLNLFQTSVFIFYISLGKVAGGTAPIYLDMYTHQNHADTSHIANMVHETHHIDGAQAASSVEPESPPAKHAADDLPSNSLEMVDLPDSLTGDGKVASLHALPPGEAANKLSDMLHDDGTPLAHDGALAVTAEKNAHQTYPHQAAEPVIYSNPLPHVLILTAIVVGVATTAVGLSLIVRIRMAYGSIEDDDIEKADWEAETGVRLPDAVRNFVAKGAVREH